MHRVGSGVDVHWLPAKRSHSSEPWLCLVVADLLKCMCIDAEGVPPSVLLCSPKVMLVAKKRGVRDNALVFAAKRSSSGIQVQYLKKLVQHLGLDRQGVGALIAQTCLELLLRYALPGLADETGADLKSKHSPTVWSPTRDVIE
eukprot:2310759-Amphidinium_carterae.3